MISEPGKPWKGFHAKRGIAYQFIPIARDGMIVGASNKGFRRASESIKLIILDKLNMFNYVDIK